MSDDKKQKKSGREAQKDREFDAFSGEERDDYFDEEDDFDQEHLFEEAEFEAEGWSIPRDPESVSRLLKSLEGLLPGVLKRAESGAGEEADASSGSEGFRARLSERKLPREAVNFILSQVDNTKREFLRIASNEVRVFLESVDLGGELAKILTTLSFEVRMEVRFIPNDQALKPSARGRMRLKRNRAEGDGEAGEDEPEGDLDEDSSAGEASESEAERSRLRRWALRRRGRDDEDAEQDDLADE